MSPTICPPRLFTNEFFNYLEGSYSCSADGYAFEKELLSIKNQNENVISKKTPADKFKTLKSQWEEETKFLSDENEKCMHPCYQEIIGMGKDVLPILIADLFVENSGNWFWALVAITHVNPVHENDIGNHKKMVDTWINWWINEQINRS